MFLRQHAENKLGTIFPRSPAELNEAVESITALLTSSYEYSCPETKFVKKKNGMTWSKRIEKLRQTARRAWNRAPRTAVNGDWEAYRESQKAFRKAVRWKAREMWKNFCAEMDKIPDYARIHRILAKGSKLLPSSLRRP